ncbi:hypothetical protein [Rhodovulum sp. P5]|uniref:hypothetical protein n=1 Tax=Rhodovulum sp. P5 TaxID=1564506 RepID=UPI001C12C1DF|nr:hypothetical protein [Rhodovulum sp. P5]
MSEALPNVKVVIVRVVVIVAVIDITVVVFMVRALIMALFSGVVIGPAILFLDRAAACQQGKKR